MDRIPVIIDCDPGVDDALALILASQKKELEILAITTVAGNVELEYTTHNARLLKSFLNLTCPVSQGASQPLVKAQVTAALTHGRDGFGGQAQRFAPYGLAELDELSAFQRIVSILEADERPVTIIALGPLTNIATLFLARPELKCQVKQISLMGGAISTGNVTPRAEFNFYVDPEAAQIVMNSGVPILMAGLDVTQQAYITDEDLRRFQSLGGARAALVTEILAAYQREDTAMHDPVAILALTNPEILQGEDCYVQVDTTDGPARGQSYRDIRLGQRQPNNCHVFFQLNREAFLNEICSILEGEV